MSSTTARIGVVVGDGYQELEFWYPVLRFREEGAAVTVIGAEGERTYVSKLGYPVIPDAPVGSVSVNDFDLIVVPSGATAKGALPRFLEDAVAKGCLLGAIGDAPRALAAAGLLRGRRIAAPKVLKDELAAAGAISSGDSVTADRGIVTAASADDLPGFYKALADGLARAVH
jgi:protease I